MPFDAFFLTTADGGRRLCLYHPAAGATPLGAVLYVHPFAEEMNKCRRMAALQARQFAAAGYAVLQIDLLGCGDSSGDFGDASWHTWIDDVVQGAQWLAVRVAAPLLLWGLRSGCLLAAAAARRIEQPCSFLFWQPTLSGKTVLQQFLRLKVAGDMLGGGARGSIDALRQTLAAGAAVEIAGYLLSPALAAGLEQATLVPPPRAGRLEWLEVSTNAESALSPGFERAVVPWRQIGCEVRGEVLQGPAFWQTTEVEEAPALLAASLAALQRGAAAA